MSLLRTLPFLSATVAVALVFAGRARGADEDRIWISSAINGKPAHLYFDTGACGLKLLSQGATRLGLKFVSPPESAPDPFHMPLTKTEECDFQFGRGAMKTTFFVARVPDAVNPSEDGSVGWQSELFVEKITKLDAFAASATVLEKLPAEVKAWTKWKVRTNGCIVALEMPGEGGEPSFINIDTGSPAGVMLSPAGWRAWSASHPRRARTLNAYYMKGTGLIVAEEAWAEEILLGPLVLKEVPVMEANIGDVALSGTGFRATLGLAALRHFDLLIDGKRGTAYSRENEAPQAPYVHNCLGAVFTPEDPVSYRGALIASVAIDSPAFVAGIRDGDALLKCDGLDVTEWRAQPTLIPSFRSASKSGLVRLTLRRPDKTFTVAVELNPILTPKTTTPQKKNHERARNKKS